MTQLLAVSFDSIASPSIRLRPVPLDDSLLLNACGWGLAWYPSGDAAAAVVKDPTSIGDNSMTKVLREWKRFRSTVFVCHIHGAAKRRTQQDTHPFDRVYAGRSWVMAHNGDLHGDLAQALPLGASPVFEPIGRTDSEHAFCWLLEELRRRGARRLADVGWEALHGLLSRLNDLGTLNLLLTDGHDLVVYRDRGGYHGLCWLRRRPPHALVRLGTDAFGLELDDPLDENRTMVIFASQPLSPEPWREMALGQMIVACRGAVTWSSAPLEETPTRTHEEAAAAAAAAAASPERAGPDTFRRTRAQVMNGPSAEARAAADPAAAQASRVLSVVHETVYRYERPVELSMHHLRLRPVHDAGQDLLEHALDVTPAGIRGEYEDVFGNQVTRLEIEEGFSEMRVVARSLVRRRPLASLSSGAPIGRLTIPLVWMPWQREMMHPYLLPAELPETQLRELTEFAMSFVERQDYDLVATLLDMNKTIHRDFAYVPGSTRLETTPFEVLTHRRGVCQDFANLLICLARLLNIPARYRVGYIFTGGDYANKLQSEASHAWAELYLPWTGWCGLDPTNGCLAGRDHIRVACGRNYREASPTTGTIYRGGGRETLEISVRVEERP